MKKAARGEKDKEQMRKWLENGLPWSVEIIGQMHGISVKSLRRSIA